MSTVAIIEARIAEVGRSRLMYGEPGWTPERAGTDSLKVKQLLQQIQDLNIWRVHKKESVARMANLRKRIDALTLMIRQVDDHTTKAAKGGARKKMVRSCALRLQRQQLQNELNTEYVTHPVDSVIPGDAPLLCASLLPNPLNSWADEE